MEKLIEKEKSLKYFTSFTKKFIALMNDSKP